MQLQGGLALTATERVIFLVMAETPQEYLARIGRKGGKARVKNQTPEQRKQQAQKAAAARWQKTLDRLDEKAQARSAKAKEKKAK